MQDLCLFSHFDQNDKVDEYVLRYLREIKKLRFSIVFISTAKLPSYEIDALRAECSDVILRENTGLDFASWATGFAKHKSEVAGRLLLANDSVYGPIGNLATALEQLTTTPADFYGFVESIEPVPHLQSWFLLFEPWVVHSSDFRAILQQSFDTMEKREIVQKGELELSRTLVDVGFKYGALYRASHSGLAARFIAMNPTQVLWRELLVYEQIPFLKIELLRDNPMDLEDKETILSVVKAVDPDVYDQIKDHLGRTAPSSVQRKAPSGLSRWANRSKSDLMREGHRLWRTRQRVAEVWNFVKLSLLIGISRLWQARRRTISFAPLKR